MSGKSHLLALDQGTSSSRSIVFDREGRLLAMAQRELPQHYPRPGWVEHDPARIWQDQLDTAREALARAGVAASEVAAVGITNQRETTIVWERRTGRPIGPAIVWQDRRAEPLCATLREEGWGPHVKASTGLVIDAYFSGPKIRWLLDEIPGAQVAAERGELAFGTVDSWLLWQLTGRRVHATDVSNASRTMLFDIHEDRWNDALLERLAIPASMLPVVRPSSVVFGECDPEHFGCAIPIAGIAGDQQSALFGQACFDAGQVKNTYGTGCFVQLNTGANSLESAGGLLSSRAAQAGAQPRFVLEGSVFIAGAVVQWLRDGLGAIRTSADVQSLAGSVPDAGGVMLVPAFAGLGAPYWRPDARGSILGLTRGSTLAHIARAALESIAFQSAVLLQSMTQDVGAGGARPIDELRVDGGASGNDLLMQFQSDLLGIPVVRPESVETTGLGAAFLAGLATGVFRDLDELRSLWRVGRRFEPTLSRDQAADKMERWAHAVRQTLAP